MAVSGLLKAEVERIWLPFAVWLGRRYRAVASGVVAGLAGGGAVTALVVNHVLLTNW